MLNENEIKKMFREMGLGSEAERKKIKELGELDSCKDLKEYVFIRLDSSTIVKGEKQNAELA